jgi:hypothetical protein
MLLCGAALLALRNFALIPSNFFTLHAMQIGSMLEMILLSFALAARFNAHKRLREQSLQQQERQLEQRVAERTEELAAANQRLQALAMECLPGEPLMSRDNLDSMRVPNVASGQLPGLAATPAKAHHPHLGGAMLTQGGHRRQRNASRQRRRHGGEQLTGAVLVAGRAAKTMPDSNTIMLATSTSHTNH